MTLLRLHYTVLHGHTTDFKKTERQTSYKSDEVCHETRNEPTGNWFKANKNLPCEQQHILPLPTSAVIHMHFTHCTVPHRPRHALAVRVSGSTIASVRGKVPNEVPV